MQNGKMIKDLIKIKNKKYRTGQGDCKMYRKAKI